MRIENRQLKDSLRAMHDNHQSMHQATEVERNREFHEYQTEAKTYA